MGIGEVNYQKIRVLKKLDPNSEENAIFYTLPTALDYQRNSNTLWKSATATFENNETKFVFNPGEVVKKEFTEVQDALTKYNLALQKNKQTQIWIRLCQTLVNNFNGRVTDFLPILIMTFKRYGTTCRLKRKKIFRTYQVKIVQLLAICDVSIYEFTFRLGLITDEELESSKYKIM